MKFRVILIVLFSLCFIENNAQTDIKRIIYSDLILINELFDYAILDTNSIKRTIIEGDTIDSRLSYLNFKSSYEKNVNLLSVDTVGNFHIVNVKFDNVVYKCNSLLESKPTFRYTLYYSNNKYYKIFGFMVSDINFLSPNQLFALRYVDNLGVNIKKIEKHLNKLNYSKLSNFINVNILEFFKNNVDNSINMHPIINSTSLYFCDSVD